MRGLRSILIAGLGGMLLVFTVAAVQAVRLLDTMRKENQVLRDQAADQSRRLGTVRYCVLLSQTYLNDHSSERRPVASEAEIRNQWIQMMAGLAAYRSSGDTNGARFEQLRDMLQKHWLGLNRAMEYASRRRSIDAGDAEPLRVSALEITSRVQDIDAEQAAVSQLMIQNQFERLGHGLGLALNFALATALLLAVGCGVYIVRIEKQNHRRYEEIVGARHDLEQLSARLVDAQEAERRAISRELHDQVGQTLNAVLVDAANLAPRIPPDDEIGQRYLNNIRSFADASVNAIRDISLLLRPSMLDDLGLIPALEWQARETSRRTGIDVRVAAEDVDDSLPDAVRTCTYRIVQEALQNVARHSGATHARIGVSQAKGTLALTVEDDGSGFDPKRTRGMGLLGMEERVRQLKGRLEIQSEPRKGTTVRVSLSVPTTE
ncbi:MAG TPA: sensor histidine kinase [Bryobacteraceae bacterium]|nr:sensor histidine kinase [Bryobacteraceae bacterium]